MELEKCVAQALARNDVRGAAEIVVREYGPVVFRYLTRILGSAHDAADALQA